MMDRFTTARPNIKTAQSHPNLCFIVPGYESQLKGDDAIVHESDLENNPNAVNIRTPSPDGNTLNIPNDSADWDSVCNGNSINIEIPVHNHFERNTVRKSRKRYRAPPPPPALSPTSNVITYTPVKPAIHHPAMQIQSNTINNNRLVGDSITNYRSDDKTTAIGGQSSNYRNGTTDHDNDDSGDELDGSLCSRGDFVRMSVMERKAIFEKRLKFRAGNVDDASGADVSVVRAHVIRVPEPPRMPRENQYLLKSSAKTRDAPSHITTTATVEAVKEVKRPFIPPPPPPPAITVSPDSETGQPHPENQANRRRNDIGDDKEERNGCDTCIDWILFLLCIA